MLTFKEEKILPSPKDIEQCLQEAADRGKPFDGEILRTVLILETVTEEYEVYALVSRAGGRCVAAGGFEVMLVSVESLAGRGLQHCQAGDTLPLGRVLAVDDSLTESAEAKRHAEAEATAQTIQGREARQDEKRRLAAEREELKLREQEAFERRAAAYFDSADAASEQVKCRSKNAQLEWPL